MRRRSIVALLCAILAGLAIWQYQRQRAVAECLSSGGVWNGPRSICDPARPSPILMRDLQHS